MTHDRFGRKELDELTTAARRDELTAEAEDAALGRVWENVRHEAAAAAPPLHGCAELGALIPAMVAGQLPRAKALLVEDHTRECVACRRRLLEARGAVSASTRPAAARRGARPVVLRWAMAAAVLVGVLSAGTVMTLLHRAEAGLQATIEAADGATWLIADDAGRALAPGAVIGARESVRTPAGSGALLRLPDGSLVEMSERAQLELRARLDGTVIDLDRGSVIVQAAPQGAGRLYVATDDCLVAVKGTVFSVRSGVKGSRVSVIEGAVEVRQAGGRTMLVPGDQLATSDRVGAVPVEEEIAWSRDFEEHVALLRELVGLQRSVSRVLDPAPRTSTRMLELVPGDTVVYAALPNLGTNLEAAQQEVRRRVAASERLAQWWQSTVVENGIDSDLEDLVERLQPFAEALGEEVVVAVPSAAMQDQGSPVAIAPLVDPVAFRALLEAELAASGDSGVLLVDDPQTAVGDGLMIWITGDLVVATASGDMLRAMAARVADPVPGAFHASSLHDELVQAYAGGVEWLVGVDGVGLTAGAAVDPEAVPVLGAAGLLDVDYAILRRQGEAGVQRTEAEVHFLGERTGVASWLAAPGPIGALEFVSPDATAVAAGLAKDGAALLDDLFGMISAGEPGALDAIDRFELEHGIDLREDLAAPLGGELALAVDGPLLPVPAWKLVVEVYDPARLQHTLEWAVAEAAAASDGVAPVELTSEEVGGHTVYTVTFTESGFTASYLYDGGYLVAAPQRALLERALQTRDSGVTLPRSAAFRDLLPSDEHVDVSAVLYSRLGELAGGFLGGALGLVGEEAAASAAAAAAESQVPTVVCAYGEPDAIRVSAVHEPGIGILGMLAGLSSAP